MTTPDIYFPDEYPPAPDIPEIHFPETSPYGKCGRHLRDESLIGIAARKFDKEMEKLTHRVRAEEEKKKQRREYMREYRSRDPEGTRRRQREYRANRKRRLEADKKAIEQLEKEREARIWLNDLY